MTISLSKSGACSVTKASAFARSAVGGLRFGGGTKAVAAVRQSSACRCMAEGRVDGVELTAVAVQQTAGTVALFAAHSAGESSVVDASKLCGASGLLFLNVAGCQRAPMLYFCHLVPHIITASGL